MINLKALLAVALLTASVSVAKADTVSGTLNITGSDIFNAAGAVTFINPATVAAGSTGSFVYFTNGTQFTINPNGSFTLTQNGETASFVVNSVTSDVVTSGPMPNEFNLTVAGTGTFTLSGIVNGTGLATFAATSQSLNGLNVATSISASTLVPAPRVLPTPEPASLVLLGTGALSSAGMFLRRRRAV